MSWRKKWPSLKKIKQKLKTWECRIGKQQKRPLWRHQSKIFNIWGKIHFLFEGWGAPPPKPPSVYVYNQYLNMCKIFSNYRYFRYFCYFNGKLRNGWPRYSNIRHQRIQINNNHRFVFRFSQNLCLTVFPLFSSAILDRRSEPRMLGYNPIQRHELKKKMTKFEEN